MWKGLFVSTVAFAQGLPPGAGEVRLGLGVFNLAPGGADAQVQYRLPGRPWLVGLRFAQWTDRAHDPFTGRALTDTRETRAGATLDYLFQPDRSFSWTVGVSLLRWAKAEKSLMTGEVGRDARTAPCVGGGIMGTLGPHACYQVGIYLAPGVSLHTRTSVSSEDDSGGFDIRAGVGLRF
jgi:hypothetical protein